MPTTSFKSPTVVNSKAWDGGSGDVENENLILTGGYATFVLPDGTGGYSPTGTEAAIGHVLPITINQKGYDFSEIPENATIDGLIIRCSLYSENTEEMDMGNYYQFVFTRYPDSVLQAHDDYWLFQPQEMSAPLDDPTQQTLGDSSDVWQPNPCLLIDGLYMYSTDGSFPGYQVQTSTVDPFSSDVFYNGHDYLIQPTTQGYNGASLDTPDAVTNFAGLVGKTITVHTPADGDIVFTGQAGAVTSGDNTFQAATSNDVTMNNITGQFNNHAIVGAIISGSFFSGIQWFWSTADVGSHLNVLKFSTNASPSDLTFANDGQFTGGTDPDPTVSNMNNYTAAPLLNVSGGPIMARADGGTGNYVLQITNETTYFALADGIEASRILDPDFGISAFFNYLIERTGDPLAYPELPDNTQNLGKIEIAAIYTVPALPIWNVFGKTYYSDASLTDKSNFQAVKFDENAILKAVMLWVVIYNDPTFTSLNLKIYSNDDEQTELTPKKLLHTSTNVQLKADVHSEDFAVKEVYFEFANVNLRRDTWYHFVLNASGYSGASHTSHIAWKNSYPDPVYPEGVTLAKQKLGDYPLTFVPIMARYDKQ